MINKIKKSAATFLASFMAFGGLASAMDSSEADKSDSQATVLPVQQQSLAPINITVINEESAAAKLLAATKIAFLGTGTIGVGACCYKVYKVVDNTGKDIQGVFNVVKTGTDDILKTFNGRLDVILETFDKNVDNILGTANSGLRNIFDRLGQVLAALPEAQARQLVEDIHVILTRCGNSVEVVNGLLGRLDVDKFNGIAPATVDMINSLTESIKNILKVDPENGTSTLAEVLGILLKKNNTSTSSEGSSEEKASSNAQSGKLVKFLKWIC